MSFTIIQIKEALQKTANLFMSCEQELSTLDAKLGDGDLGLTMVSGARAMRLAIESYQGEDIGMMLQSVSAAFNRTAPSTLGTLFSAGLRAIGSSCKGKTEIVDDEIANFPRVFCEEIQKRGKAKQGDKTILDALIPYVQTFELTYHQEHDLHLATVVAENAAQRGMEETKGMIAKAGRARWLGERNKEYPDGCAVLCCSIAHMLAAL